MNAQIIAITNQKGGVGKTTTTVNLGVGLARQGRRVLLVDGDPQGSLTISMGVKLTDKDTVTLANLMHHTMINQPLPIGSGLVRHREGVDLLPADIELSGVEMALFNAEQRERVLQKVLESLRTSYDYILIDCTPSLGMMTINALTCADSVIVPTQADFLSTKGLNLLFRSIANLRKSLNPKLRIDGILLTMVDSRTNFAKAIITALRESIALIALFLLIAVVSGGICIHQFRDAREAADSFRDLEDMLVLPTVSTQPTESIASMEPAETVDPEIAEAKATFEKYKALYEQNEDLVGWISIEGTAVNYPVMQSVDRPDFYLKHGFDRQYSRYGVPYLDEACATGLSNNLVIYGHNMKNGTMFHDLLNYTSEDFRKENPIIHFDTLSRMGAYQVVLVFRFDTDNETFCYNEYTDMNEEEFVEFMEQCRQRQLYDTGISVSYGDELLTLSTCEYTYKNGRFVVVAKRILD